MLTNDDIFFSIFIPVSNIRIAVIADINIKTISLNMARICKARGGFKKQGNETWPIAGYQITLTIFIPVANYDCCTLASA